MAGEAELLRNEAFDARMLRSGVADGHAVSVARAILGDAPNKISDGGGGE